MAFVSLIFSNQIVSRGGLSMHASKQEKKTLRQIHSRVCKYLKKRTKNHVTIGLRDFFVDYILQKCVCQAIRLHICMYLDVKHDKEREKKTL